jgi:hypothetical protein
VKTMRIDRTGKRAGLGRMLLYHFGVMVAAFVGGMFGAVSIFPLGLVVRECVIWPLTLTIGALFAALSAAWPSTYLTPIGHGAACWQLSVCPRLSPLLYRRLPC